MIICVRVLRRFSGEVNDRGGLTLVFASTEWCSLCDKANILSALLVLVKIIPDLCLKELGFAIFLREFMGFSFFPFANTMF